ncbi:hypothetical protein MK805_02955 [Shimazuella sp. AN120528]|uniref:hypothetical protein n=1 Tax=Shimazuella soli TaxID=1892854 RepID=UPI001F10AF1D|nr:hypothetical protein [Shimazuella soli]MCH5583926.1 hypothetical protein [Shimazuella soli]
MNKKTGIFIGSLLIISSIVTACSGGVSNVISTGGDPKVNEILNKAQTVMKENYFMIDYKLQVNSPDTKDFVDREYKLHYVDENNFEAQWVYDKTADPNFKFNKDIDGQKHIYINGYRWWYDSTSDQVYSEKASDIKQELDASLPMNADKFLVPKTYLIERAKSFAENLSATSEGNSNIIEGDIPITEKQLKGNNGLFSHEFPYATELKFTDDKYGWNGLKEGSLHVKLWIDKSSNLLTKAELSGSFTNIYPLEMDKDGYVTKDTTHVVHTKEIYIFEKSTSKIQKPKNEVTDSEKSEAEYH